MVMTSRIIISQWTLLWHSWRSEPCHVHLYVKWQMRTLHYQTDSMYQIMYVIMTHTALKKVDLAEPSWNSTAKPYVGFIKPGMRQSSSVRSESPPPRLYWSHSFPQTSYSNNVYFHFISGTMSINTLGDVSVLAILSCSPLFPLAFTIFWIFGA